ncbi:MAG: hypothetical protein EPO26_16405 [Chloroflexota bacterium]|nr:MAG: hypothetical protein EPO26_16405 [Chloroflexota bacterium]
MPAWRRVEGEEDALIPTFSQKEKGLSQRRIIPAFSQREKGLSQRRIIPAFSQREKGLSQRRNAGKMPAFPGGVR